MATAGQIVNQKDSSQIGEGEMFADMLKKVERMQESESVGAGPIVGTSKTEECDSMKILSEAGNILNPRNKLVTMIQKLNSSPVTNASPSLRSITKESLETITKLMVHFSIIEESLRKLSRIKNIIEKKNRNQDEKKELIEYAIEISPEPVVKQWLSENSDVFSLLVALVNFIRQKLDEEVDRKKKEEEELERELEEELEEELEKEEVKDEEEQDWKRKKIELIFFAHGSIENQMIPASSLLPSTSITDVLLYSPWNCLLSAETAYSIATGSIQPGHQQFQCKNKDQCNCSPDPSHDVHTLPNLPRRWNSMKDAGCQKVPNIIVSPVANGDPAFDVFIALKYVFDEPPGNRYLITFLDQEIGELPFFAVTLAISVVLPLYEFEATVHLAACLGKSPEDAVMQEEYLSQQYAYTVDNTTMIYPPQTFLLTMFFDMFKRIFGD